MFTLIFDPPVDAATQEYCEQLVSDYLVARQEAVNLATLRAASDDCKAKVQALLDAEQTKQDASAAAAAETGG